MDLMDSLINGVCGTVTHLVSSKNNKFPQKVYVRSDDYHVGTQRNKQSVSASIDLMGSTAIQP